MSATLDEEVAAPGWDGRLERLRTYRLNHLVNLLNQDAQRLFRAGIGLSLAQWRVVGVLHHGAGATTAARLCRMLRMDPGLLSRLVAELEGMELVARAPAGGRRLNLSLTPAGSALARRGVPMADARQKEVAGLMTAAEAAVVDRVIDRMIAYFEDKEGREAAAA